MTATQSVKFNQLLQAYVSARIKLKESASCDELESVALSAKARQRLQDFVANLSKDTQ